MKERYKELDLMKGIGILLVYLGHTFNLSGLRENSLFLYLYRMTYSFHMPLFFFISGLLSNTDKELDLKKFYKKEGYKNYSKGYLFKSQQHQLRVDYKDVSITPYSVGRYLREARDLLDIQYPIGTHSFRKTWGYNVYNKTKDIALVMKALNHSSPAITLRYIGIEQETLNATYDSIEI